MMESKKTYGAAPFILLAFIYFLVGFLTTVNGQFQGPLKIAFLEDAGSLKNTFTTSVSFFFFLGYLLNSNLAARWVNVKGYRVTMLRALGVMVIGLLLYEVSTLLVIHFDDVRFVYQGGSVPWGFAVFLIGSFLMGTSAAMLQVVINPYVSAYNLRGTSPAQRLNITTAVNSFGTTIAPFFVTMVVFSGVSLDDVTSHQLLVPFVLLALVIFLVTLGAARMELPDLSSTRAEKGQRLERSIWSFRHLTLGGMAIFFYVGTEVGIGSNVNLYAMELIKNGDGPSFFGMRELIVGNMDMGIPALLATLYWGGFLVGRAVSSFYRNFNPRKVLIFTTFVSTLLILLSVSIKNLWLLSAVGLFHSVMWSCIFTLATTGLREYTSKASGVFMMGVFGGAVFPVLQGVLADVLGSWQLTWSIPVICELVMLVYAVYGYKVTDEWCLNNIHNAN